MNLQPSLEVLPASESLRGFIQDIANELAHSLNFSSECSYNNDGFGMINPTTTEWSGLLKRLITHEIGIAVGDFTITSERLEYFDFTWPIISSHLLIYAEVPSVQKVRWSTYFTACFYLCTNVYHIRIIINPHRYNTGVIHLCCRCQRRKCG